MDSGYVSAIAPAIDATGTVTGCTLTVTQTRGASATAAFTLTVRDPASVNAEGCPSGDAHIRRLPLR